MTWKCPACGREFARKDQDHYCLRPTTVEEYIDAQTEDVRGKLRELRSILCEAIPEAEDNTIMDLFRTADPADCCADGRLCISLPLYQHAGKCSGAMA